MLADIETQKLLANMKEDDPRRFSLEVMTVMLGEVLRVVSERESFKDKIEALESEKGKMIIELIEIMSSKDFLEITHCPVTEGEEVVGEMMSIEKALLTKSIPHKRKTIINSKEVFVDVEAFGDLRNLMWASIVSRINIPEDASKIEVGIREDYKIVLANKP